MTDAPMIRPGEVSGRPKLVVRYPTDPNSLAALLPPGFSPWGEPTVLLGVYCVPVHGEPEHGISTKIPATFNGVEGWFTLGIGIDQESAIFISQETNGQPKFPCEVTYFRLGNTIEARATHQGYTFMAYRGNVPEASNENAPELDGTERVEHEWWIKHSRKIGGGQGYDFPPHVVDVRTAGVATHIEPLSGELILSHSPWDPIAALLPICGEVSAELVTMRHTAREITVAGPLDPDAFWPFADTIGGSRWPGMRGAPRSR